MEILHQKEEVFDLNSDIEIVPKLNLMNEEEAEKKKNNLSEKLVSDEILNGNFTNDIFTYTIDQENASEECLIFIVHGIGQNKDKLKNILNVKVGPTIENLYKHKFDILTKQIHVRIIDWKSYLVEKTSDRFQKLLNRNHETRYPKLFIQQTPLDILHYLSDANKYDILRNVVDQMNMYYQCVKKHRPLFRGSVTLVGHSLGSIMMYDILKELTFLEELSYDYHDNTPEPGSNISSIPSQSSPTKKKLLYKENEMKRSLSVLKILEETDKSFLNIDRKNRTDVLKTLKNDIKDMSINSEVVRIKKESIKKDELLMTDFNDTIIKMTEDESENFDCFTNEKKIYSKKREIKPLIFVVDHFFLLGSPLSLFLTIELTDYAELEEMEIVKDFHNVIHPMDPIAYRIEPLIKNFPQFKNSFLLPHWANDGRKHIFFDKLFSLCLHKRNNEDDMHLEKTSGVKRYDFIVQEYLSEKAVHLIGFLFSHQAYWNNPDVFYFIVKMIHWQGYISADQTNLKIYTSN
jgi:hypothetical protein